MTLHPQARAALAASADDVPVRDPSFDVTRARADARAAAAAEPREDLPRVEELDAGGVPCRLYVPTRPGEAVPGLVLHLHGGGFVLNDVEVHDAACRRLAARSGRAVLSVDYRRPPEHRFPAAPDDVDAVLAWLTAEGPARGLEVPVVVHGDSAGANLALVATLRHPGRFAAAVLIYPFLDPTGSFPSYRRETHGFDPRDAAWMWEQYASSPADLEDPDLAPLLSPHLATLPPTLVVTAEHDPLVDEGEHLVALLSEAGVEVTGTRYLGMLHGFWRHPSAFDAATTLNQQVAAFVAHHLP